MALANGVMGTVVGFEWPEGVAVDDPERQPIAIKVLFDKRGSGKKHDSLRGKGTALWRVMFPTAQCLSPQPPQSSWIGPRDTIWRGNSSHRSWHGP
jgi:hypothetical protein